MRLINTESLEFKEFFTGDIPEYAIISHRWGDKEDEVTYDDFVNGRKRDRSGWRKIASLCNEARKHTKSYEWVWIDTCCINKSDQNELLKSINLMFSWYQNSGICYVYLHDFEDRFPSEVSASQLYEAIRRSEWFKRGWTLQELIAPYFVDFYDQNWKLVGSKQELASVISRITGINEPLLKNLKLVSDFSVAQRLSWAAGRHTSEPEDRAYSLAGLFGITLRANYGEGSEAFFRLQKKILKKNWDQSIFAWTLNSPQSHPTEHPDNPCSILAPSPDCFARCNRIVKHSKNEWRGFWNDWVADNCESRMCLVDDDWYETGSRRSSGQSTPRKHRSAPEREPFEVNNVGLGINLRAISLGRKQGIEFFEAALCCYVETDPDKRPRTILLAENDDVINRSDPFLVDEVPDVRHRAGHAHWDEQKFTIQTVWNPPVHENHDLTNTELNAEIDKNMKRAHKRIKLRRKNSFERVNRGDYGESEEESEEESEDEDGDEVRPDMGYVDQRLDEWNEEASRYTMSNIDTDNTQYGSTRQPSIASSAYTRYDHTKVLEPTVRPASSVLSRERQPSTAIVHRSRPKSVSSVLDDRTSTRESSPPRSASAVHRSRRWSSHLAPAHDSLMDRPRSAPPQQSAFYTPQYQPQGPIVIIAENVQVAAPPQVPYIRVNSGMREDYRPILRPRPVCSDHSLYQRSVAYERSDIERKVYDRLGFGVRTKVHEIGVYRPRS